MGPCRVGKKTRATYSLDLIKGLARGVELIIKIKEINSRTDVQNTF